MASVVSITHIYCTALVYTQSYAIEIFRENTNLVIYFRKTQTVKTLILLKIYCIFTEERRHYN